MTKTLLALILLILPPALPTLPAQEVRPDVPALTAKTARWSRNDHQFEDEEGNLITETVRLQGVDVEVYFNRPPQRPYEVQAFFFARNEENGTPFIYDAEVIRTQEQVKKTVLRAEPLLGTVKKSTTHNIVGWTQEGKEFIGVATKNSSVSGSKVYGWVVRVVSVGQIVRMDSNQTSLKKLAQEAPHLLDDALVQLEQMEASEN